jgi:subtilisin family serine protease
MEERMRFVAGILTSLLIVSTALGGEVDPELAAKIKKSDPNDMFRTLIFMSDQFDVFEMKRQHNLVSATRAQRHYDVITALQAIATETQTDLLVYLTGAQARGTVESFRGFWITNMISAEMTPAEIRTVASRADVYMVSSDFDPKLIEPITDEDYEPPSITSVEIGLRAVRADSMWMLGYTGQGRLVCNIDTGVDGDHPALNHSWRGSNGYTSEESWLDTANPNSDFPYDADGHGTHTMGTICGRSTITDDTIGVAMDAQWIAARAIVGGGNAAEAFQWAADPDGDPRTIEDVPDVISNSWRGIGGCPSTWYTLIDNCEAAGAAVIFAAGNEGPGPQTIGYPPNRITTPYNCFSVGAINGHYDNYPIANWSSRGPSNCDGETIKPEVVAPGVTVRSSVPGGGYQSGNWSGTSMACPHVAGAVALLRQVNPNATVDTIKWALMETAQDLGSHGEDNAYGHGIINILHAMDLIPPVDMPYVYPNAIYVYEPNDDYPDPGETIDLFVRLANTGIDIDNVSGIISTEDQYTTITSDSAFYGFIAQGDTALSSDPYVMSFAEDTPPGRIVDFDLRIVGDGDYSVNRSVSLMVGRLDDPAIADHDTGNVLHTISNFGQYGLHPDGMNGAWDGAGFKMPQAGMNYLFEGALFIGDGPTRVSNGARDQDQAISDHFVPMDRITLAEPGPFADQEYYTSFNDQNAPEPLGVLVSQETYAFEDAPDDNYVIFEYTITNTENQDLEGVLVAHFEDWDMDWGVGGDRVNFDRQRNLGYQYDSDDYRGQAVLSDPGVFSFMALDNEIHVYPPYFTMEDKWSYMNAGIVDTAITTIRDCSVIITTGPFDIAPGESVIAAFAILGGTSLAEIQDNAAAAIARYGGITAADDDPVRPDEFFLSQNYPNPFNAQTAIEFSIPTAGDVRLEAFDLLGRKVTVLIDEKLESGYHSVIWDCSDLSTGVYFYRLTVGDNTAVRKMTLIK